MNDKLSALSRDADMIADAAIIQPALNTATINTTRKTEDLLDALKKNRARLAELKNEYVKAVKTDGGVHIRPSGRRRLVFNEIMRLHGAMEAIKNELTQRGAGFDIDVTDHEHPNAAFKRITTGAKKPDAFGVLFWYLVLSAVVFILWFFSRDDWREVLNFLP